MTNNVLAGKIAAEDLYICKLSKEEKYIWEEECYVRLPGNFQLESMGRYKYIFKNNLNSPGTQGLWFKI